MQEELYTFLTKIDVSIIKSDEPNFDLISEASSEFEDYETGLSNILDIIYDNKNIEGSSNSTLEEEINNSLTETNNKLIFNLSNLDYISSAGLGVFMSFIQELRENGGDIKFTNLNEKVRNVMDLLGFNHIYDITQTEQEAIEKYASRINE